jgi:hypothetical protein
MFPQSTAVDTASTRTVHQHQLHPQLRSVDVCVTRLCQSTAVIPPASRLLLCQHHRYTRTAASAA